MEPSRAKDEAIHKAMEVRRRGRGGGGGEI